MMTNTKKTNEVWVLGEVKASGELSATVFELTGVARKLADELSDSAAVNVVLLLDAENSGAAELEGPAAYGADRITVVRGKKLPYDRAACAKILAHLAKEAKPEIVLASATAFGRAVMPYAAALLGAGLTADCTGLAIEPGTKLLLQTRPAIGGNIMATIKTPNHRPQMATVRPRTFRIPEPNGARTAEIALPKLPEELLRNTAETLSFKPFDASEGTLQEREAVVSGGKGLRRPEGFALLSRLASLIDAGVGASRPVVEMKWIAYPHQVGLSGQVVSPKVYVAAGISGTVQHLAGMQTSGKIVAINRDPEALIWSVADVGIVGDLYDVIPRLIAKIEARKGRTR